MHTTCHACFCMLFFEVSKDFQVGRDALASALSIQQWRPPPHLLTNAMVVVGHPCEGRPLLHDERRRMHSLA